MDIITEFNEGCDELVSKLEHNIKNYEVNYDDKPFKHINELNNELNKSIRRCNNKITEIMNDYKREIDEKYINHIDKHEYDDINNDLLCHPDSTIKLMDILNNSVLSDEIKEHNCIVKKHDFYHDRKNTDRYDGRIYYVHGKIKLYDNEKIIFNNIIEYHVKGHYSDMRCEDCVGGYDYTEKQMNCLITSHGKFILYKIINDDETIKEHNKNLIAKIHFYGNLRKYIKKDVINIFQVMPKMFIFKTCVRQCDMLNEFRFHLDFASIQVENNNKK